MISIKGHNSVINLRKMTGKNPNLYLVNMNAHTKFGQDIEQKRKSDISQGPLTLVQICKN